jgi:hypothetical protein
MAFDTGKVITNAGVSGAVSVGGPDTITGAKDFTGAVSVLDASFTMKDQADTTKIAKFELSGITTGATRTLTIPDTTGTVLVTGIGYTIGAAWTFSSATNTFGSSTAAGTIGVASGATIAAATKTVNIGTAGVSTSVTNVNIGSSVAGALGTLTINSPTVAFGATVTAINLPVPPTITSSTVAGLPAATAAGKLAFVTNGSVAHAGNSGTIVAGGGANFLPVYSDGTNWRIM